MSEETNTPALVALGWSAARERVGREYIKEGLAPARVLAHHRARYLIGTAGGDIVGILPGRARKERSDADRPVVGDWVLVRASVPGQDVAIIDVVLPRTSAFVRRAAGERTVQQIVAANVDLALIATAVVGDLNLRRLERYVALAWESAAIPLVLLTKSDLAIPAAFEAARSAVLGIAPGVDVIGISTLTGEGVDDLSARLVPGQTAVLVGSSGVGKSSLVNLLLGRAHLTTRAVRDDGRGRHTTTHRELVRLESGALLIDTPGMRELQLWGEGSGLETAFTDVEQLSLDCRFGDCGHGTEPGCAVRDALARGALDAARFESYLALKRELAFLSQKTDASAAAERRRIVKQIHRAHRASMDRRPR